MTDLHRTQDHDRLLSALMEWTMEQPVLRVLIAEGVASPDQLFSLARGLDATVEGRALPTTPDYVDEHDCRDLSLTFLRNNAVRLAIAKSVAATHDGVSYEQAKADLNELRRDLEGRRRELRLGPDPEPEPQAS